MTEGPTTRGLGPLLAVRTVSSVSSLGAGSDVVLVPGLAVSRYLQATHEMLAADGPVHLAQLPGTGEAADPPRRGVGLATDVLAVTTWIRSHLDGPVLLVGHSYGSQVVSRVATALPDQVRAVVLASPTIDPAYRPLPALLSRFVREARHTPIRLGRLQLGEQRRAGVRRMLAMVRSMLKDDLEESIQRLDVQVTVVRAELDDLSTRAWARHLADRPGGEFVEVAGASHAFPFDHPDALVHAVRATSRRSGHG
ncbi:alpha/beta fold hydrolase [Actinopolymorpha pittospori]